MKKFLIHLGIIITFIIIFFLQTIIFSQYKIAGIMPNLFIILMVYIGLYMGKNSGISYGIIFGIFIDLWVGKSIGVTSISLAVAGAVSGFLDKTLSKDNRIMIVLIGSICTIISEIILYILQFMFFRINLEIVKFIEVLLVETIYNILLIIILYPLIKFTGEEIESEIKGDKILTRYF